MADYWAGHSADLLAMQKVDLMAECLGVTKARCWGQSWADHSGLLKDYLMAAQMDNWKGHRLEPAKGDRLVALTGSTKAVLRGKKLGATMADSRAV